MYPNLLLSGRSASGKELFEARQSIRQVVTRVIVMLWRGV
jgi:hypothetical protein